jgi:DNA-directed RNA polymerase subunit beta
VSRAWPLPPDPLGLQLRSFARFAQVDVGPEARTDVGLQRALTRCFPIESFAGDASLTFTRYAFDEALRDVETCRRVGATYTRPLRVTVALVLMTDERDGVREIREVREAEVDFGDTPWMTAQGTFVVDGRDRAFRPQLARCPGVWIAREIDPKGQVECVARVVPYWGRGLSLHVSASGRFTVKFATRGRVPGALFLRALGVPREEILALPVARDAFMADGHDTEEAALMRVGLANGEDRGEESDSYRHWLRGRFFSREGLDLGVVGRARMRRVYAHDPGVQAIPEVDTAFTRADLLAAVARLMRVSQGATPDDLEDLSGAFVRGVGDYFETAFARALEAVAWAARERLSITDPTTCWPVDYFNARPIDRTFRELLTKSSASERAELGNPASLVAIARCLTTAEPDPRGPQRSGFTHEDTHASQYGLVCPVDGVDDARYGVGSLALFVDAREDGALRLPTQGHLAPDHAFGFLAALVPFAAHDEPAMLTAGARNLRDAIPVCAPHPPRVGTSLEGIVARASRLAAEAPADGVVKRLCARTIELETAQGTVSVPVHRWQPDQRTTRPWHERVRVNVGDRVKAGEALTDGPGMHRGELALGSDVLAALVPWGGFNDEGAVVISERVIAEGRLTSVHVTEVSCPFGHNGGVEVRVTRDAPGVTTDERAALDHDGLARVGTAVRAGDILAGRVMIRGASGETSDLSLRVPRAVSGVLIRVERVDPHVRGSGRRLVRDRERVVFHIASRRALAVGDLLGTRHGTRATLAKVVPEEDMPLMPDGRALEVILNPACLVHPGVALGTMYEMLSAASEEDVIRVRAFDRVDPATLREWSEGPGRGVRLRDGRTGERFVYPALVGVLHVLKLSPCVEEVFQARADGPRDAVTGQPASDARHDPGQELDEDTLFALAAHGAAHTLREAVTVRADDVRSAAKVAEGATDTPPGTAQGAAVLWRELQALGLAVEVVTKRAATV